MASKIIIKSGQRARILRRVAHNLPQHFTFSARPLTGTSLAGKVTVQGSNGPFSKPATRQPLQGDNTVSKGAWDVFYSVYITPDQDTEITLNARQGGGLFIWVILAVAVLGLGTTVFTPLLK